MAGRMHGRARQEDDPQLSMRAVGQSPQTGLGKPVRIRQVGTGVSPAGDFLRWAQEAFANFSVVPPGTGIVHQVNLEYLARVVFSTDESGDSNGEQPLAYPDTVVGTDSHTPMVNGLGVLGWGVGGIEAEAAMLGQPITMLIPPDRVHEETDILARLRRVPDAVPSSPGIPRPRSPDLPTKGPRSSVRCRRRS